VSLGLDSDADSFMMRSAVPSKRRVLTFNIEENTLPEDTGAGNSAFKHLRAFSRLWVHMETWRHKNDMREDSILPTNNTQVGALRDHLNRAKSALHQFSIRRTRAPGKNAPGEEGDEAGHELGHVHDVPVLGTVSPAYGTQRIMAAGDQPGRLPGGDTVPRDEDVSPSSSDYESSEDSHHPLLDALCYYDCTSLFTTRDQTASRATRRQRRAHPAHQRISPAQPEQYASREQATNPSSAQETRCSN